MINTLPCNMVLHLKSVPMLAVPLGEHYVVPPHASFALELQIQPLCYWSSSPGGDPRLYPPRKSYPTGNSLLARSLARCGRLSHSSGKTPAQKKHKTATSSVWSVTPVTSRRYTAQSRTRDTIAPSSYGVTCFRARYVVMRQPGSPLAAPLLAHTSLKKADQHLIPAQRICMRNQTQNLRFKQFSCGIIWACL